MASVGSRASVRPLRMGGFSAAGEIGLTIFAAKQIHAYCTIV